MERLVLTSRPITDKGQAFLLCQSDTDELTKYPVEANQVLNINLVDPDTKYCTGWYDIATHTNHICDEKRTVKAKHESCFGCRNKTGFNPAFYNSGSVSEAQTTYNNQPHTVYVAYFGNNLAKAGIMSDTRGLERIYEQGALYYTLIKSCDSAHAAHELEDQLIKKGLRNSVTKRQKEQVFTSVIDDETELESFSSILAGLNFRERPSIVSNLNLFFFGKYPSQEITPISAAEASGAVIGVVGRYIVLRNGDRLFGCWLSDLFGYQVSLTDKLRAVEAEPEQVSLL